MAAQFVIRKFYRKLPVTKILLQAASTCTVDLTPTTTAYSCAYHYFYHYRY